MLRTPVVLRSTSVSPGGQRPLASSRTGRCHNSFWACKTRRTSSFAAQRYCNQATNSWPLSCTYTGGKTNLQDDFKENPMNIQRTIFASAGILLLLSSAAFAEQVQTDYDYSTEFSRYKTYAWETVQSPHAL